MCTYLHFVTDCRSMIHDNTAMRITTQKALSFPRGRVISKLSENIVIRYSNHFSRANPLD